MDTTVMGINAFYDIVGSGDVMLILEGWNTNADVYSGIVKHYCDRFTVCIVDLPGFGKSAEPLYPFCVDDYCKFVCAFLEQLKLTPVVIFGHSFGGRVAVKLISRGMLLPSKMVLTGSAGIKPTKTLLQRAKLASYKVCKGALSLAPLRKLFPNALETLRKSRGSADYNKATPIMRATLVKVVNEDLTHLFHLVGTDTLLIWGSLDTETPLAYGKKMEELMPNAGLAVMERCTHFAFLEDTALFCKIMDSFL